MKNSVILLGSIILSIFIGSCTSEQSKETAKKKNSHSPDGSFIVTADLKENSIKDYPVEEKSEDGKKYLLNPVFPRDGVVSCDLIEEISIGDKDDSINVLAHPYNIALDKDSSIFILDWQLNKVKIFNKNGEHVKTFGREGRGPSDFSTPSNIFIKSDTLYLLDGRNMRIQLLDLSGKYLSSILLKDFASEISIDSKGFIYIAIMEAKDEQNISNKLNDLVTYYKIKKYHITSKKWFDIGKYKGETIKMQKLPNGSSLSLSGPNRFAWVIDSKDIIYWLQSEFYKIHKLKENGEIDFIFGKTHKQQKRFHSDGRELNDFMPAIDDKIVFDENGNIWLRYITEKVWREKIKEYIYDVFSTSGIFIKQVKVKYPITMFKNGRVYSITRNAEDLPVVKRFKLVEQKENNK